MREAIRREAMVLLTIALLAAFFFYGVPLFLIIRGSFETQPELGAPPSFAGLQNFQNAVQNPEYIRSFWATAAFTFPSVLLQLAIAFGAALISRRQFWGAGIVRWVLLTSYFLPSVVVVVAWKFFTDPFVGLLPRIVHLSGLPAADMRGPNAALPAMIITATYEAFPFTYVVLLSRMMQIPATLYQVTESLGASSWKTFVTVTWPQIRIVAAGLALLRILITWPKFDIPWLVYASQAPSKWGDTLAVTVYRTAFERLKAGEAYAVSLLLLSCAWLLYAGWNMVRSTKELQ